MTHKNEFTTLTLKRREDRGVALVTALLILMLFTVMTLSMVIATSSDTLIDGYYRNARGSFYAADSGLNAVRQALLNDINNNDIPTGYVPSSGAPHLVITNALPSDITGTSAGFGSYQSILGSSSSGSAASWPGTFKIDTTTDGGTTISMANSASNPAVCNAPSTTPITTTIDCVYTYSYRRTIPRRGSQRGRGVRANSIYGPHAGSRLATGPFVSMVHAARSVWSL
jgi:Tfp pilus assembly protein PilX